VLQQGPPSCSQSSDIPADTCAARHLCQELPLWQHNIPGLVLQQVQWLVQRLEHVGQRVGSGPTTPHVCSGGGDDKGIASCLNQPTHRPVNCHGHAPLVMIIASMRAAALPHPSTGTGPTQNDTGQATRVSAQSRHEQRRQVCCETHTLPPAHKSAGHTRHE
jgi:hypothetical protein